MEKVFVTKVTAVFAVIILSWTCIPMYKGLGVEDIYIENSYITVSITDDGRFSVFDKRISYEWVQQIPESITPVDMWEIEKLNDFTILIHTRSEPQVDITLTIDDNSSDLKVEIIPLNPDDEMEMIGYPYPFVPSSNKSEIVMPIEEGVLVPVDLGSPEYIIDVCGGWLWTMSWYGEIDSLNGKGYMVIADTPDDAALAVMNVKKGGETLNTPALIWISSLGKVAYTRKMVYHFSDGGGYVPLTKYYRQYAINKGYFRSLREKAEENPDVAKLIGGARTRIIHITELSPEKFLEVPEYIGKGEFGLYVFNAKALLGGGELSESGVGSLLDPDMISQLEDRYPDFHDRFYFSLWTTNQGVFVYKDDLTPVSLGDHPYAYLYPFILDVPNLLKDKYGNLVIFDIGTDIVINNREVTFASICPSSYQYQTIDYLTRVNASYEGLFNFDQGLLIDVFAGVYECWDTEHPVTRKMSKEYRIQEAEYLKSLGYVVTVEGIGEWAIPVVDAAYGLLRTWGERNMGEYNFCLLYSKEAEVNPDYDGWYFNPARRVPLQELVYHDAIISTFHDGDGNNFYYSSDGVNPDPNLQERYWNLKDLFEILYGAPPTFHIVDDSCFEEQKDRIKETVDKVCSWHEKIGYDEMTNHLFLTEDRMVQQSSFSSGWNVIVNFDEHNSYDFEGNIISPMGYFTWNNTPMNIEIEKPREGYLYGFDREIMPTIFGNTIVLGKITIEVDASDEDGIEKVEFYIDDVLKNTDYDMPYDWLWDEFAFGNHGIKVIAHDKNGNKVEDKINVIIFNFGG